MQCPYLHAFIRKELIFYNAPYSNRESRALIIRVENVSNYSRLSINWDWIIWDEKKNPKNPKYENAR